MMTDYLILTTLKVEFDAVVAQLTAAGATVKGTEERDECDANLPGIPGQAASVSASSEGIHVLVRRGVRPGRVPAALVATEVFRESAPPVALLVGVAGGVAERTMLGDVVIADQVIDVSERVISDGQETTNSKVFRAPTRLLEIVRHLGSDWTSRIVASRPDPDTVSRLSVGALASSDVLFRDASSLKHIRNTFGTLRAVDMEAAGILEAIDHLRARTDFLVVRGIADLMGPEKAALWRDYAAHAAAACAVALVLAEHTSRAKSIGQHSEAIPAPKQNEDTKDTDASVGGGLILTREIEGRAQLNAADYAAAIADVLNDALGEICFSLMGHWGRGKTYLARLLSQSLPAHYHTVWFSAWKYRTRPELWAYLYESFWRGLSTVPWFFRIPRLIRGNLHRHGIMPFLLMLCGAALAAVPFGSLVHIVFGALGIIGAIRGVLLYFERHAAVASTLGRYLAATRYNEKLGLQAAIGDDLEGLIVGWAGDLRLGKGRALGWAVGYGLSVIALVAGLWYGFHPRQLPQLQDLQYLQSMRWYQSLQWYPSDTTVKIVLLVLITVATLLPVWVFSAGQDTKRILLVVDDLDRMLPNEMLEVVESLKLFLESSHVSDVVQILMICEEEALRAAIRSKYCQLRVTGEAIESHRATGRDTATPSVTRAIEENMQKLFVAHLRLPPLSRAEQTEILVHLIGEPAAMPTSDSSAQAEESIGAAPTSSVPRRSEFPISVQLTSSKAADRIPELTDEERRALQSGLQLLAADGGAWAALGPRSIMTFVFRYKLARRLLVARHVSVPPDRLARSLAERMRAVDGHVDVVSSDPVAQVVAEVA